MEIFKKAVLILSLIVIGFVAYCSFTVDSELSTVNTTNNGPEIILRGDPCPDWLVEYVVKQTNQFCKNENRGPVKRVTIYYYADTQHAEVRYLCTWD